MIQDKSRASDRLLFAIGAMGAALCLAATAEADDSKPNIVLIIADDQAYGDFGFMGNEQVRTPNLDRLAFRSARYPHGYVPTSVCRPSLATILTGLYPHQHGIHFNHPPPGFRRLREFSVMEWKTRRAAAEMLIRRVPTLPAALAEHGYVCLQTGKHWEGNYKNAGFTHGMTLNEPSAEPAYGNRELKDGWVAHGNGDAGLNIGRDSMQPIFDFIDKHAGVQPFFVWYAPFLPHTPFDAGSKYRRHFENQEDIRAYLVGYYAGIARFDETVGQLVDYIEGRVLADQTLFLFVVDNGYRPTPAAEGDSPRPSADDRSKLSVYENGVRTPILVRWDGRTPAATHDGLVQSVDIAPTILAAAGISGTMGELPGISLLPSVTGKESLPCRPAFGEIFPNDASSLGSPAGDLLFRWIREGDFKLIVGWEPSSRTNTFLYNLARDPHERHNLAEQPNHAKRVQRLRALLDGWWTPASDVTQIAEPSATDSGDSG